MWVYAWVICKYVYHAGYIPKEFIFMIPDCESSLPLLSVQSSFANYQFNTHDHAVHMFNLEDIAKPFIAAKDTLNEGIASFYDESSELWEDVWGEHMHHGYYPEA